MRLTPDSEQQSGMNAHQGPLCSIVLGTYNRPKLLRVAIDSVMKQSYQNWECLVVNDGGCDVQDVIDAVADVVQQFRK